MSFDALIQAAGKQPGKIPPVENWHPELCGDIDIRIDRQGNWFHEGTKIQREALVVLFASILRKEEGEHFLVTPHEKMRIKVDDTPFLITLIEREQGIIRAVTNTGDVVEVCDEHPLVHGRIDGVDVPLIEIRRGLMARFSRNAFYQLADWCESDGESLVVRSGNYRFVLDQP